MVHVETYERKVTIKQPKFLPIIDKKNSERLNVHVSGNGNKKKNTSDGL